MTTYNVKFETDTHSAGDKIEAVTPEEALEQACAWLETAPETLSWERFEIGAVNFIEITEDEGKGFALWRSEELTLRLAAPDLLAALEQALEALNTAPRFRVRGLDSDSYKIAAVCEAAIMRAKGRG